MELSKYLMFINRYDVANFEATALERGDIDKRTIISILDNW